MHTTKSVSHVIYVDIRDRLQSEPGGAANTAMYNSEFTRRLRSQSLPRGQSDSAQNMQNSATATTDLTDDLSSQAFSPERRARKIRSRTAPYGDRCVVTNKFHS